MKYTFRHFLENSRYIANRLGLNRKDYGRSADEQGRWLSDLYHLEPGEEDAKNVWVWYFDGYQLHTAKGTTHGAAFGHDLIGRRYKGRYNTVERIATIALPYSNSTLRSEDYLIQNDPNAIPVINAIRKRFSKVEKIFGV